MHPKIVFLSRFHIEIIEQRSGERSGGGDDEVVQPPAVLLRQHRRRQDAPQRAACAREHADQADRGADDGEVDADEGDHEGAEDGGDEEEEADERVVQAPARERPREEGVRQGVEVQQRGAQQAGRAREALAAAEERRGDEAAGERRAEGADLPAHAEVGGALLGKPVHADAAQHDVVGARLPCEDGQQRREAEEPEGFSAQQRFDRGDVAGERKVRGRSIIY